MSVAVVTVHFTLWERIARWLTTDCGYGCPRDGAGSARWTGQALVRKHGHNGTRNLCSVPFVLESMAGSARFPNSLILTVNSFRRAEC